MKKENYKKIYRHYEKCFEKHGNTAKGLDWPNKVDLERRFDLMTSYFDIDEKNEETLLDFGCGTGFLLEYLKNSKHIKYSGLDISKIFIDFCRDRYPNNKFLCIDILKENLDHNYDYIICNGVFTEKNELSEDDMFLFFSSVIKKLFCYTNKKLIFNVMSNHVDYKRDDLFHLSHDKLCEFLTKKVTRNYLIDNSYGLYEYTVILER